jgi:diaminopimelate decarboxylase
MYDAWHDIHPIVQHGRAIKTYDIVGPVCETGDTFATQREMAEVRENDLVVIRSAGAYGATMSGTYNSRPLVAEVLVRDGKAHLIRRRQSYDEMFALEQLI